MLIFQELGTISVVWINTIMAEESKFVAEAAQQIVMTNMHDAWNTKLQNVWHSEMREYFYLYTRQFNLSSHMRVLDITRGMRHLCTRSTFDFRNLKSAVFST